MIAIKQVTVSEIDIVAPLFNQYRVFYKKESDYEAGRDFLLNRITNNESIIYLAMENQSAIGFTQLYPLFSSTRLKRVWLLNDLFVHESHRDRGISKLLLEKGKKLTRDTNSAALILETEVTNQIGNKLYPSVGFTLDRGHNHYYWENLV